MVTTPKMRHSKSSREPLTIDLNADPLSGSEAEVAAATAAQTVAPEAAGNTDDESTSTHLEQDEPSAAMREPSGYRADGSPTQAGDAGDRDSIPPAREAAPDGFSRIVAGIIGAVVAVAAAAGLQYFGVLGAPGSGSASNAQVQIDELKQQIAGIAAAPASGDIDTRIDGLSSALDAVKADVAALKAGGGPEGAGGSDAAGLQALDERIKAVEAAIAAFGQAGGAAPDAGALAALSERIAAAEAASKAAADSSAQGGERIAKLEQSVSSLAGKVASQAAQPKIALSIATAALQSAIDRGAPFLAELETLAALAPESPEIARPTRFTPRRASQAAPRSWRRPGLPRTRWLRLRRRSIRMRASSTGCCTAPNRWSRSGRSARSRARASVRSSLAWKSPSRPATLPLPLPNSTRCLTRSRRPAARSPNG